MRKTNSHINLISFVLFHYERVVISDIMYRSEIYIDKILDFLKSIKGAFV